MNTKLIEDSEQEVEAHAKALKNAVEMAETLAARVKELESELADATDQIGRAEMAEKAMYARVAELENRYRALIPGDVIQEWDEIFVYGDWMLADVKHYGILITQATGGVIRRRIGKDASPKIQRIADALADGKPDGQEENS
jgi:hypothetical protein